jgi:hypothetical protein
MTDLNPTRKAAPVRVSDQSVQLLEFCIIGSATARRLCGPLRPCSMAVFAGKIPSKYRHATTVPTIGKHREIHLHLKAPRFDLHRPRHPRSMAVFAGNVREVTSARASASLSGGAGPAHTERLLPSPEHAFAASGCSIREARVAAVA